MKISEGDFIFELKFLAIHPQSHNIQTDVFLQVSHQEQAYQEIIDLLSVAQLEECLEAMKNLLEKGEEYSSEFEQSRLAVLLEKLEDEYDLQLMKEYEERKERNEVDYVSFEDMKEVFEI